VGNLAVNGLNCKKKLYMLKNSLAVKNRSDPVQNGQWGKSCEIKGGSQEIAVMV